MKTSISQLGVDSRYSYKSLTSIGTIWGGAQAHKSPGTTVIHWQWRAITSGEQDRIYLRPCSSTRPIYKVVVPIIVFKQVMAMNAVLRF